MDVVRSGWTVWLPHTHTPHTGYGWLVYGHTFVPRIAALIISIVYGRCCLVVRLFGLRVVTFDLTFVTFDLLISLHLRTHCHSISLRLRVTFVAFVTFIASFLRAPLYTFMLVALFTLRLRTPFTFTFTGYGFAFYVDFGYVCYGCYGSRLIYGCWLRCSRLRRYAFAYTFTVIFIAYTRFTVYARGLPFYHI